jgi:hypothetical protein
MVEYLFSIEKCSSRKRLLKGEKPQSFVFGFADRWELGHS